MHLRNGHNNYESPAETSVQCGQISIFPFLLLLVCADANYMHEHSRALKHAVTFIGVYLTVYDQG